MAARAQDEMRVDLRVFLERILDERDKQYDARFRAAEVAVNAALTAQKEATAAAFTASEKAIVKQEEAQTTYNVGHNDLSRKMDDQYKTMMPRTEVTALFKSHEEKLEALRTQMEAANARIAEDIKSLRESRSEQSGVRTSAREIGAYVVAALGFAAAILSRFIH
jgi:uncharacterized protein involved in exopolysaccharide biosynthesis